MRKSGVSAPVVFSRGECTLAVVTVGPVSKAEIETGWRPVSPEPAASGMALLRNQIDPRVIPDMVLGGAVCASSKLNPRELVVGFERWRARLRF